MASAQREQREKRAQIDARQALKSLQRAARWKLAMWGWLFGAAVVIACWIAGMTPYPWLVVVFAVCSISFQSVARFLIGREILR